MRLYYEVARRAFQRAATYRVSFVAGMVTNAFFGAMLTALYTAVYADQPSVAGYSRNEAITYLWIGQAMISVGGAWVNSDLTRSIRNGDVAVDLMRPWNYYGYWLSQQLGDRTLNLLVRGLVTFLAGVILFGAYLPTLTVLPGFLLSLMFAVICSCAVGYLANLSAFWLIDNNGVMTITSIIMMFFSGFLIPLAFMPAWLQTIAYLLPFQAITSIPIEVFLGRKQGLELLASLGMQMLWASVLTLCALAATQQALRKLVIQGG